MSLIQMIIDGNYSWAVGGDLYKKVLKLTKENTYENGKYDPNKMEKYDFNTTRNALHFAVVYGCEIELFDLILSKIKDVNAVDEHGLTALMMRVERVKLTDHLTSFPAAMENVLAMFKSLLKHPEIKPNMISNETGGHSVNQTALMFAIKKYGPTYRYSQPNFADHKIKTKDSLDAIRNTGENIILELIKKSDLSIYGGYTQTPGGERSRWLGFNALHHVIYYGCSEKVFDVILAKIKEQDMDVNTPTEQQNDKYDYNKETPLMLAIGHNYYDKRRKFVPDASSKMYKYMITKLLGDENIDLNAVDGKGRTALYHAVRHKDLEDVKLLLATGKVDYTIKPKNGFTPLELAFRSKYSHIVTVLSDYINKQGCCANPSLKVCERLKL